MKSPIFAALTLFVCASAFAVEVDPKLDRAVREALPLCSGEVKLAYEELPLKLPTGFSGRVVNVESSRHACDGQWVAVTSPSGGFYLGSPWPIGDEEGATLEQKFTNFTWRNMQQHMKPVIDRSSKTKNGLYPVTLEQITENGKVLLSGEIDPEGKVFFFGHFRNGDLRASRVKAFEPFLASSPAKGASSPVVTIVEFSDFQCPSCQRSSGWVDPIVAKYGEKVRYIRYDLPLSGHAWAFPAALAGRAIYRQSPEKFWEFKKQVYASQSDLNAFTFWDWARGFAEDHELDLAKYDADLANEELKATILKGAGTALSNDIRATPSYLVNGTLVDAGDEGKALAAYVEKLLQ